MEFFAKAKVVRLKSHLNKYLIADDDQITTRQSLKGGDTRKSRWTVELVDGNPHVIRLKSCFSRYLAASDDPSLLTGGKIIQSRRKDFRIDWQPIRDGFQVKLKSYGGSYLKANGGTPPWRNTVTHGMPRAAPTRDWVVWDVDAVEVANFNHAVISRFTSVSNEICSLGIGFGSALSLRSGFSGLDPFSAKLSMIKSPLISIPRTTISIDVFKKAKVICLKSSHGRYLTAGRDGVSVTQGRNKSSREVKWTVEFVENSGNARLKSCYGKYLTVSKHPYILGFSGRKVLQKLPDRLDSSVEWEPFFENGTVKLKAKQGQFLRANSSMFPWRYAVTNDFPHRTGLKDWVLWEVQVVELVAAAPLPPVVPEEVSCASSVASLSRQESNSSLITLPPKGSEGRLIYFRIADENGKIYEGFKELCITFKGNDVNELTWRLEEDLGVDGLTVCALSPLNGKLYPLRLQLPPNNATMHVVVVPPPSEGSEDSE